MNNLIGRKLKFAGERLAPTASNIMWMMGGIVFAVAITVSAQQAMNAVDSSQPCPLTDAASTALNNNVKLIGMTSPDPSKYFSTSGVSSCIGEFGNLDLSSLIPDLAGMISDAASAALTKLMNKACGAVKGAFGDTINQYNSSINSINGVTNGNAIQNTFSNEVGKDVDKALSQYNTSYNTSAPAPLSSLANQLRGPGSANTMPLNSGYSTQVLNNNGANAGDLTSAAGNLEMARIQLEQAKAAQASAVQANTASGNTGTVDNSALVAAQNNYESASTRYNSIKARVNSNSTVAQPRPIAPSQPGSSTPSFGTCVTGGC